MSDKADAIKDLIKYSEKEMKVFFDAFRSHQPKQLRLTDFDWNPEPGGLIQLETIQPQVCWTDDYDSDTTDAYIDDSITEEVSSWCREKQLRVYKFLHSLDLRIGSSLDAEISKLRAKRRKKD